MIVQTILSPLESLIYKSRENREDLIRSSSFPNAKWKHWLHGFPTPNDIGDKEGPRFKGDKSIEEVIDSIASDSYVNLTSVSILSAFYHSLSRTDVATNNKVLQRILLLNKVVFYNFKKKEDSNRKYEADLPKFIHPPQVTFMLPKYSPDWLIFAGLLHDTAEDSHRYKLLEKWCSGENLDDKEYELLGITNEQRKAVKREEREKISNDILPTLIELVVNLSGIKNEKTKEKVSIALDALTIRIGEHYQDFAKRIGSIEDKEIREGVLILKMGDRLLNSYYPVGKEDINNPLGRGVKFLKDSVKNFYILQEAKKYINENRLLENPERNKEFLTRYYALADITNRNMNELMSMVVGIGERKEMKFRNKDFCYWIEDIDEKLSNYPSFTEMTTSKHVWSLFDFDESIETLTRFIDIETYHGKDRLLLLREGKISGEPKPGTLLRMYKYAAIIKVLSSKFLSCNPFFEGELVKRTYGTYDPLLNDFYVETRKV